MIKSIRTFKTLNSLKNVSFRRYSCARRLVLGIETSCDDTGAAVVDENGVILGEGYKSQMKIHLDNGGVIPHIAVHFHKENIESVISSALKNSKINLEDVTSIAVTTKPGLKGSLLVGVTYAKQLAEASRKPLIPIHHMEAHALTARLLHDISFPFLCLLASGGHCQLTLVKGVDEFLLLGDSIHNSPGEVLDKIARRLKLQNLPECYEMSGGKAIDYMARGGDSTAFKCPLSMAQYRDCNFSFSGFVSFAMTTIAGEEEKYDVAADGVIPSVHDFCASLLQGYAVHLSHRILRAFAFCEQENLISSDQRTLVFSGGVACNTYIKTALEHLCVSSLKAKFYAPPPKLCTDNGIMIAWNGMEKLKANLDILPYSENLVPDPEILLPSWQQRVQQSFGVHCTKGGGFLFSNLIIIGTTPKHLGQCLLSPVTLTPVGTAEKVGSHETTCSIPFLSVWALKLVLSQSVQNLDWPSQNLKLNPLG